MRKFIGTLEDFVRHPEREKEEPMWADYQVLGPMFSALRMFMTMKGVLPVIIGAKGCAYHLNFTIVAWGEIDFDLGKRPLPVLQYTQTQIITGNFSIPSGWLNRLKKLAERQKAQRIVLFPTDAIMICGAKIESIAQEVSEKTGIAATALNISAMCGANQWAGYKAALDALYRPLLDTCYERTKSVNLVGWMWPSRKRNQEIGCCMSMLQELGIAVNAVVSGGSSLADIERSLTASANAVVCSSVMGEMLETLDRIGIRLAGSRAPYGFTGTCEWLKNISDALDMDITCKLEKMKARYLPKFLANKERLKGKRVFVSGGPGRIVGLLHALNDYEMDIQVACMFWPHAWSREDIRHLLAEHGLKVGTFILSPGLDDLEWAASHFTFDVWMGGYQEQHTCARHGIPFVPITVYTVTHVGFEGAVNLGNKMLMAMDGHSFVDNCFTANEIEGYTCTEQN